MNALALVTILFSHIINTKCQEQLSAFSCALGKSGLSESPSILINKLHNATRSSNLGVDGYIEFFLYTKENVNGEKIVLGDAEILEKSNFSTSRPTKIITHGYLSSSSTDACTKPRDAFLSSGDYNVIVMDWYGVQSIFGSIPLDYWTVTTYVGEVGSYVAAMINFLENHGMNVETTTLIGHSLGAHVMGIAGYQATNKVNYIVGLDPALPSFDNRDHTERLSIEDAETVEVIHTNEGDCGMSYQIGHYDFYPNGGKYQPGCGSNVCSHARVYELYAESIHNINGFYGRRCLSFDAIKEGKCFGDYAIMGGDKRMKMTKAEHGMYYLETGDKSPYALGTRFLNDIFNRDI